VNDAQFKELSGILVDLSSKVAALTELVTAKSAEDPAAPEATEPEAEAETVDPDPAAETVVPPAADPEPALVDVETAFAGILQAALSKL
jgi:hypothetical protein